MSKYLSSLIPRSRSAPSILTTPSSQLHYAYKTRFALLGTVGSGKSTVAAAMHLTAQTLSSDKPNFYVRTIEANSRILDDVSRLRRGHFPEKTKPYEQIPIESGLLLTWRGFLNREKRVQIPLCDVAGEDFRQVIHTRVTPSAQSLASNISLINYVKDADGFLLVVPASRAMLFHGDEQIEEEDSELAPDPDVNLARILNAVLVYKEQSRGAAIKGIAVVITKWDLIEPYAVRWGMDLYDETGVGIKRFMDICFPSTSAAIKRYVDMNKVQFFPSHISVLKDEQGEILKWRDGGDRIDVVSPEEMLKFNMRFRIPKYSETSYVNMFNWLQSFAL